MDMFQAEGLLKHCLEPFRKRLKVKTSVEALVWAHGSGPEAARRVAEAFVAEQAKEIQVGGVFARLCGKQACLLEFAGLATSLLPMLTCSPVCLLPTPSTS